MGKRIIAQRRGSGSPKYRKPSFNFTSDPKYLPKNEEEVKAVIIDMFRCRAHSSPIIKIMLNNKTIDHIAPEGVYLGQEIYYTKNADKATAGNVLPLKAVPEGSVVFGIENVPGDGGKLVRAAGTSAKIISKTEDYVLVRMPSKKDKKFHPECRATIGIVAGGGITEKPICKAGKMFYIAKAKHKLYPKVSGAKMNAVSHPFGNKRSSRKSKARPVSRHAPPGRKVGYLAARRTGRKK